MPAAMVASAAGLLAVAVAIGGFRRVPDGHAAVVLGRKECRLLRAIGGWVWRVPGIRRLTLVDLARTQVASIPSWYRLPGGGSLRLGLTVGLSIADPCRLAASAQHLSASLAVDRSGIPGVGLAEWAADRLRHALPSLLADAVVDLDLGAGEAPPSWQLWPRLRLKLAAEFEPHGLVVQEVWLQELSVATPQNS